MAFDPPHPPDDDDHLSDFFSDEEYSSENAGYFTAEDEDFQNRLEELRPRGVLTAIGVMHDPAKSEDLTDHVIVHLFANRKRPPEGHPLDAWFLLCVRNKALDAVRSPAWGHADDRVLINLKSEDHGPLDDAIRNEEVSKVRRAFAQLSCEDQDLLRLWFIEEVGLKEMAHLLNAKQSTLYSRIMRAKERLLKNLKKGGRR